MKSKVQSPKPKVPCLAEYGARSPGEWPAVIWPGARPLDMGMEFRRAASNAERQWTLGLRLGPFVTLVLAAVLGSLPTAFAADTQTSPTSKVASVKSPATGPETPDPKLHAPALPQSVFIVPKARGEGVDPFFPLSTRLNVVDSSSTNKPSAAGELLVKGFSGTATAPLVIINDRTFGVGDEKEVVTAQGRARVRCLEIRLKDESTLVEANHERRELYFRKGK